MVRVTQSFKSPIGGECGNLGLGTTGPQVSFQLYGQQPGLGHIQELSFNGCERCMKPYVCEGLVS